MITKENAIWVQPFFNLARFQKIFLKMALKKRHGKKWPKNSPAHEIIFPAKPGLIL